MIEKIILKIDGKKIELSPEQAKNLKDELEMLFGEKKGETIKYVPYEVERRRWPYVYWGTNTQWSGSAYTITV